MRLGQQITVNVVVLLDFQEFFVKLVQHAQWQQTQVSRVLSIVRMPAQQLVRLVSANVFVQLGIQEHFVKKLILVL
tara:strand:- start:53 stop:280 length:228 start_codon:yes stop_codon:yes gene_type:complete